MSECLPPDAKLQRYLSSSTMKKCSLKANDEHSSALSMGHQLIQEIEVAAELVHDDFEDVRIAALN